MVEFEIFATAYIIRGSLVMYQIGYAGIKAPFLKIVGEKGKSSCKKGGKKGMNENDFITTNNN